MRSQKRPASNKQGHSRSRIAHQAGAKARSRVLAGLAFISAALAGLGVAACGAPEQDAGLEMHEKSQHLVLDEVPGVALNFTIQIPQSSAVQDFVIGATDSIQPRDRLNIVGGVVSKGEVLVGNDARLTQITAKGRVKLGDRTQVSGAVLAGGAVQRAPTATVGSFKQYQSVPFRSVSWTVTRPGGTKVAISLEPDQKKHLAPGNYGNLSVKSRSKLFLNSGEYFFDSVTIEPQATLVVENGEGPVEFYVSQAFTFRGAVSGVGGVEPQLFVGYSGQQVAYFDSPFKGVIVAPQAELRFQSARPQGHTMSAYAKKVTLEPDTIVRGISFDWGPVAGAKEVPGMPPGTPIYEMPRSDADISVSSNGGEGEDLSSSTTLAAPVDFTLPPKYSVSGGTLARGKIIFKFGTGGTQVTCTYIGGSSTAAPLTAAEMNAGRTAHFEACSDGLAHDVQRQADSFELSVEPSPGYPVSVSAPARVEDVCTEEMEILSADDTYKMAHNFQWANATKVATKDQDGNDALYYAWIYIRDQKELLALKQLYIHVLHTPFFTEEWNQYQGKCGSFVNQSDGEGEFVSAIIPAVTYNKLIDALSSNEVEGDGMVFDAVILRDVPAEAKTAQNSIKWKALGDAGFRYLDYEADPFRDVDDIQLDSGISKALSSPIGWIARAVRNSIQATTDLLGALDRALQRTTEVTMHMHAITKDIAFATPNPLASPGAKQTYDYGVMTRGWGEDANRPLGAEGMEVRVMQWLFGLPIPTTHPGKTDAHGKVDLKLASESGTSKAICMELRNRAAQVSGFILPKRLCDLREWDSTGMVDEDVRIKTNEDGEYEFKIHDTSLMGMYQADDIYNYALDVIDYKPKRAHILTGFWAHTFSEKNDGESRPYAPCLNLSNTVSDATVYIGLGASLFPGLSSLVPPATPVQGTGVMAGTVASSVAAHSLVQAFSSIILSTDIVMPETSPLSHDREVMTHEYGHYLFCNLLHEENKKAVNHLVWSTFEDGDDTTIPLRYLNEAVADYFTGQVAGGLDYGWAVNTVSTPGGGDYCSNPPGLSKLPPTGTPACFEENNNNIDDPSTTNDDNKDLSVGRIATLLHDAFDGHEAERGAKVPNDADLWQLSVVGTNADGTPIYDLPLIYSPTAYQNQDSQLERVALHAHRWKDFTEALGEHWKGPDDVTDRSIYEALNAAMQKEPVDVSWCDRCRVFALHQPGFNSTEFRAMLQECVDAPDLAAALGSPPSSVAAINADTCEPCPLDEAPQADGSCDGACSVDVVVEAPDLEDQSQSLSTTDQPAADTCPQTFVVEVKDFAGFGSTVESFSAGVGLSALTESACEVPFSLTSTQFDSAGAVLNTETSAATGSYGDSCIGLEPPSDPLEIVICGPYCDGNPSFGLEEASGWPGSMRFEMLAVVGQNFSLSVSERNPVQH